MNILLINLLDKYGGYAMIFEPKATTLLGFQGSKPWNMHTKEGELRHEYGTALRKQLQEPVEEHHPGLTTDRRRRLLDPRTSSVQTPNGSSARQR